MVKMINMINVVLDFVVVKDYSKILYVRILNM